MSIEEIIDCSRRARLIWSDTGWRHAVPPPSLIDAPWVYVMQAPLWAEELDRADWIAGLKRRWQLVTMEP